MLEGKSGTAGLAESALFARPPYAWLEAGESFRIMRDALAADSVLLWDRAGHRSTPFGVGNQETPQKGVQVTLQGALPQTRRMPVLHAPTFHESAHDAQLKR